MNLFPISQPYRRTRGGVLLLALLCAAFAGAAGALPQRDLLIDLREADASQAGAGAPGWSVRSADALAARERPPQQLRVRNGASGSVRLTVTRPLQVWQAAPGPLLQVPVPVPSTQWIEAGQRLTVQPRWPGGREAVEVTLSLDSSQLDPGVAPGSAELPQRLETGVNTSVRAVLGEWVTLAATGVDDSRQNVVSSGQAASAGQRILQLRVRLAP
jgi:hypothetical protein